jgi:hypothetical protein
MSVIALPLSPDAHARALLHALLEASDVIGRDAAGRIVIQLAVGDWLLEQLLTFDGGAENLENGDDAEPNNGPVVLCFDREPAKRITSGIGR